MLRVLPLTKDQSSPRRCLFHSHLRLPETHDADGRSAARQSRKLFEIIATGNTARPIPVRPARPGAAGPKE